MMIEQKHFHPKTPTKQDHKRIESQKANTKNALHNNMNQPKQIYKQKQYKNRTNDLLTNKIWKPEINVHQPII